MDVWSKLKNKEGIKVIEGETDFEIINPKENESDPDNPVFYIKVGNKKFEVEERIFDLVKKENLRVYYFPTPKKIILSLETLENI